MKKEKLKLAEKHEVVFLLPPTVSLGHCLDLKKFCKIFHIPYHIESFRRIHGILNINENKN